MSTLRAISALLRLIFACALLGLAGLFALHNHQPVTFTLPLSGEVREAPLYATVLAAFALGVTAGLLSSVWYYQRKLWKLYSRIKKLARKNTALEQERQAQQAEARARGRAASLPAAR